MNQKTLIFSVLIFIALLIGMVRYATLVAEATQLTTSYTSEAHAVVHSAYASI